MYEYISPSHCTSASNWPNEPGPNWVVNAMDGVIDDEYYSEGTYISGAIWATWSEFWQIANVYSGLLLKVDAELEGNANLTYATGGSPVTIASGTHARTTYSVSLPVDTVLLDLAVTANVISAGARARIYEIWIEGADPADLTKQGPFAEFDGGGFISWMPALRGVDHYEIHRSQTLGFTSGPETLWYATPGDRTAVGARGQASNVPWYYKVVAVAGSDPPIEFPEVEVLYEGPEMPTGLTLSSDATGITVSWTPQSTPQLGDASGYYVLFSPLPDDCDYNLVDTNEDGPGNELVTSWKLTPGADGIELGTRYYISVQPYGPAEEYPVGPLTLESSIVFTDASMPPAPPAFVCATAWDRKNTVTWS